MLFKNSDVIINNGETPELREEIVNLGMNYGIIVEGYTALLITTDEPVTTEDPVTGTAEPTMPPPVPTPTTYTAYNPAPTATAPASTYFAVGAALDPLLIGVVGGVGVGFIGVILLAMIIYGRRRS